MMKLKMFFLLPAFALIYNSCEEIFDPGDTSTDPRDDIVDVWSVIEDSELFKSTVGSYTVEIEKDENDSLNVLIYNFYNVNREAYVTARLYGKILNISSQEVEGFIISGSGTISNNKNKIDWAYKADLQDGDVDNVTAVYERF